MPDARPIQIEDVQRLDVTVTVVRSDDSIERIADRAARLLEERATRARLSNYGGSRA